MGATPPGVWSDTDRELALAYDAELASVCHGCGTRHEDWIDPETGRLWDPPRWEPVEHSCPGCEAQNRLRDALSPEQTKRGVTVRVAPYDPARPNPVASVGGGRRVPPDDGPGL